MKKTFHKQFLLALIIIVWTTMNYNPQMLFKTNYLHWGWNLSLLASIFIILLMRLRNPKNWKQWLGIDFNVKDTWVFLISMSIILVLSYFLVRYVAGLTSFVFRPQLFHYQEYYSPDFPFQAIWANYLYYIPETFNEEMLVGAMLLFGLERRRKNANHVIIAVFVALVFSLMHQALYKFSPVQPGITLTYTTLATLFFVGVLRNALILKTRKIIYSWAIHLSFNLIFFPGFFIDKATGNLASEPEKFNVAFGNRPMFFLTLALAILSVIWLIANNCKRKLSFS